MVPKFLLDAFATIPDPRVKRTQRHRLRDVLMIALLAVINGADGWHDIELFGHGRLAWLRDFLELPNGIPSDDTFRRVFEAIRPEAFGECMAIILQELAADLRGKTVAIDGKTLRGSFDRQRGQNALHVVSAWVSELGISLGQVTVDAKSNEISAIPELLETLEIQGATVTLDAMGCQKAIAASIAAKDADYILAVKDNQPTLHAHLEVAFADFPSRHLEVAGATMHVVESDKSHHGRYERRRVRVLQNVELIDGIEAWKNARSIVEVERTRTVGDATSVECAYYLTSLASDAMTIGHRIRSHWQIENSLHWVLDVTFNEDGSRIRDRNSASNLSALRKLATSLLSRTVGGRAKSIASKRKLAGWQPDFAFAVLASFSGD